MRGIGEREPNKSTLFTERLINFTIMVLDIVESLPDTRLANHVGMQLIRSGSSPAPNYAEAISAESRRDFIHKLSIALKELQETHVWLKIIRRKSMISTLAIMDTALAECSELIAILVSSIKYCQEEMQPGEGLVIESGINKVRYRS